MFDENGIPVCNVSAVSAQLALLRPSSFFFAFTDHDASSLRLLTCFQGGAISILPASENALIPSQPRENRARISRQIQPLCPSQTRPCCPYTLVSKTAWLPRTIASRKHQPVEVILSPMPISDTVCHPQFRALCRIWVQHSVENQSSINAAVSDCCMIVYLHLAAGRQSASHDSALILAKSCIVPGGIA